MARWFREAIFASREQVSQLSEPETDLNECDVAILSVLNDEIFSSIRAFSRLTHLSRTSAQIHLTQSLGYVIRHLHWVSHSMSAKQKPKCVDMSRSLLHLLENVSHQS
jgi:hypothetical protein